jgi:hypothetical protein
MALIAAMLLTTQSMAADESIVDMGTHKGVIVSPSGLVLTADHCGNARMIQLKLYDGTVRQAVLKYSPPRNGIDESQVYHIVGGGSFPFSPIADKTVRSGERVSSSGGKSGEVISAITINHGSNFQTKLDKGIVTNWKSIDRDSGSPLFNEDGEVVGLLSMSGNWPRTYWIGLDSIKQSIQMSQPFQGKRRLVMFSNGNKDSLLYEKEIAATSSRVTVIRTTSPEYQQWAAEYQKHTNQKLVAYPTFWVESTNKTRQESYRPGLLGALLGWFKSIIGGIIQLIFGGSAAPGYPSATVRGPDLPPAPVEPLQMENLTVVILAAKQDVGVAKGAAIKLALGKASGPLRRKLNEALEGKARIEIIPERIESDKYLAVTEAAGVTVDKAVVLVLVRSQSLGLKALIAGRVERAIEGKIPPDVPVEIIFERLHRDDFASIMTALSVPQAYERSLPPTDSPGLDIKGTIKSVAAAEAQKLISSKLKESENTIARTIGERLDKQDKKNEDSKSPFSNGIIATLLSVLGIGYGSTEGTKAYRKNKKEKILAQAINDSKVTPDEARESFDPPKGL